MGLASKTSTILLILLILSAFCIAPVVASDNVNNVVKTQLNGVTHMSDAFYDKTTDMYKWLIELREKSPNGWTKPQYAYMGITNCLKPNGEIERCEVHDLNDPDNPHPYWAEWLELEHNNPVKILINDEEREYALIYPPKEEISESPWLLPGVKTHPVAVVGLGCLIADLTPEITIYAIGIATTAGVISIATPDFDRTVSNILTHFQNNPLFKDIGDHFTYLTALKHGVATKNNHDIVANDDHNGVKDKEDAFEKNPELAKYATITTYQTKADRDNGCPKQIKYYDKNGKKDYDIDFSHGKPESHTFPHVHKWSPAPKGSISSQSGNKIPVFRVGKTSTVSSLAEEGVIITKAELAPILAEVQTLTEALMSGWEHNKCKDYDYMNHRFKHGEF